MAFPIGRCAWGATHDPYRRYVELDPFEDRGDALAADAHRDQRVPVPRWIICSTAAWACQ
jgi:hypothetical protein